MKKTICIAAPVASRSGYGAHSRDIVLSLIKSNKYDVSILSIPWGNLPLTALNDITDDNRAIAERIVTNISPVKPDVFIHITIPNEFQPVGVYNIGITAGIETDMCHANWIEGCNRMDLVITTSQHSADVFLNTKYDKVDEKTNAKVGVLECTTPIRVLFEGVDQEIYKITSEVNDTINNLLESVTEPFNYLFVGQWIQGEMGADRKDIGMLIKTFIDAFKNKSLKNRAGLILKTNLVGYSEVEQYEILNRIRYIINMSKQGSHNSLPNVYLIHGELTDVEMNLLYNHPKVKAFVTFTKGEGFGRPLMEFASIGKPVLASKWSGHLDFLHPDHHLLLPGELTTVHPSAVNDWILPEAKWFTVNYTFASMAMNDVVENYDIYSKKARKYVNTIKKEFSLDAMSKILIDIIDTNIKDSSLDSNTIKLPKLQIL